MGRKDVVVQLSDRCLHSPRGFDHLHPKYGRPLSGIGRKPQGNRPGWPALPDVPDLFNALTTFENVKIGRSQAAHRACRAMLGCAGPGRGNESDLKTVELLRFVGLTRRANELSSSFLTASGRRLEIARALARAPKCSAGRTRGGDQPGERSS